MAPRNQSKSKSGRWYKSSEVLLLAYISLQANLSNSQPNDHIKELSASAAEFLSSELNRPYKARHIKEKVERLWHRYGRNKSLSVNEIYEFGANPRTLPRLETYRKGIFVEIGWKTSVLKRYLGEIKCSCLIEFEDGGSSVRCEKCGFWQHVCCYYGDAVAIPKNHTCKECQADAGTRRTGKKRKIDQDKLSKLFLRESNLRTTNEADAGVLSRENELEEKVRQLQTKLSNRDKYIKDLKEDLEVKGALEELKTVGDSRNTRIMDRCVPSDGSIMDAMQSIQDKIHHLVEHTPLRAREVNLSTLRLIEEQHSELYNHLRLHCGVQSEPLTRAISSGHPKLSLSLQQSLRNIISVAMTDWILCPDIFHATQTEFPLREAHYQYIQNQDGFHALRDLHQGSWYILTQQESDNFKDFTTRAARSSTERLNGLVTPLLSLIRATNVEEQSWILNNWTSRPALIEGIFKECIELKAKLPFRQQYFEFYMPNPGTDFDDSLMEATVGVNKLEDEAGVCISACVFPAVVVYPTRFSGAREEEIDDITGFFLGISRRDDDREDGEVMLKAVVWL